MAVLVLIERDEDKIKKTSFEAVSYGAEIAKKKNELVFCIVLGSIEKDKLKALGKFGCQKVIHVKDTQLDQPEIRSYANIVVKLVKEYDPEYIITAQSSIADPIAAILAVKTGSSLVTNVTSLPEVNSGCRLERGIYSGKAFETVELNAGKKIISIKKNASGISEYDFDPEIINSDLKPDTDAIELKITGNDKAKGDVLLSEAEIVVSGGRGLKGPENWGMVEELADVLHAAKGCSKPVSDANWRPHREHVGQTGIKVSPNLYIAIGISGAIQHLAGVSSSKYIVVINNDPDAPFFKAADYGIVGDAFKIVPKLIESIKKYK